jgi:hypothetical protein
VNFQLADYGNSARAGQCSVSRAASRRKKAAATRNNDEYAQEWRRPLHKNIWPDADAASGRRSGAIVSSIEPRIGERTSDLRAIGITHGAPTGNLIPGGPYLGRHCGDNQRGFDFADRGLPKHISK